MNNELNLNNADSQQLNIAGVIGMIGELVLRVQEFEKFVNVVENTLIHIEKTKDIEPLSDLKKRVSLFLSEPYGKHDLA